jgi:vacuolar-type H+-ATPase subunit C/Vma6
MARCDFANARLGGRRGRFLGDRGIRELIALPDLVARLEYLRHTDYGHAARDEPDRLEAIDRHLWTRFVQEAFRIQSFLEGKAQRELFGAFLSFEDVRVLKTALRGVARAQKPEDILAPVSPTPGLPASMLQELATKPDIGTRSADRVADVMEGVRYLKPHATREPRNLAETRRAVG